MSAVAINENWSHDFAPITCTHSSQPDSRGNGGFSRFVAEDKRLTSLYLFCRAAAIHNYTFVRVCGGWRI